MTDRQRPVDERGKPLPFTDFKDFRKLMYLARTSGDGSDFQCSTRAGKITEWFDARPQPSYDEIEAVTLAQVEAMEDQEELDRLTENHSDPVIQAMLDEDPVLKANVRTRLTAQQSQRRVR